MIRQKFRLIILFLAAAIALTLLPSSFSQLRIYRQNHKYSSGDFSDSYKASRKEIPQETRNVIYIIYAVIIAGIIIYMFVSGKIVRALALTLAAGSLFLVFFLQNPTPDVQAPVMNLTAPQSGAAQAPEPQPEKKNSYAWLNRIFLSAVCIIIIITLFIVIRKWIKRPATPGKQVSIEAKKALDDIREGVDLKELIIRCYYEMTQILAKYHQLELSAYMTTRDFETFLRQAGFLTGDISRLSRLFEKARYGRKVLGKEEENEAVLCLEAISGVYGKDR